MKKAIVMAAATMLMVGSAKADQRTITYGVGLAHCSDLVEAAKQMAATNDEAMATAIKNYVAGFLTGVNMYAHGHDVAHGHTIEQILEDAFHWCEKHPNSTGILALNEAVLQAK